MCKWRSSLLVGIILLSGSIAYARPIVPPLPPVKPFPWMTSVKTSLPISTIADFQTVLATEIGNHRYKKNEVLFARRESMSYNEIDILIAPINSGGTLASIVEFTAFELYVHDSHSATTNS